MTKRGAPAAYRGYRLQAIYTLMRILSPGMDSFTFHPEGYEDLDIELDTSIHEAIQVKSYENLVLSNLSPESNTSFFRRALKLINSNEHIRIRLVNFGSFGEEIQQAWAGSKDYRERIQTKLTAIGYSDQETQILFEHIELETLEEADVELKVFTQIQKQLTGIDPQNAFDLLQYWLYVQSEHRNTITYSDLISKIQSVGKFINERFHHQREWFTSIQPIEEFQVGDERINQLREEFYRGVSTRYEHILADLDFQREQKMTEISDGLKQNNVVIIHAASGQGKTTLAYRYLHNTYPEQWRFSVQLIEDRQHALRISRALAGHADALKAPMIVFVDVSPSDTNWPELVKHLSYFPLLKILVTVREEDFRSANISDAFEFVSVDLSFTKDEAKLIYVRARDAGHRVDQLTFEDAWHSFGEDGLLLEFIYLLTQTETLRKRLEGQVNRLRQKTREKKLAPDELHLLRLVAVASAYDAKIQVRELLNTLDIPEPSLTIELFEEEYLLRITPDKEFITGLHPIRSRILCEFLIEPAVFPWLDVAAQAFQMMPDDQWESFILQAYLDHPNNFDDITEIIQRLTPESWAGVVGIVRCLLWAGIKKYIHDNWNQILAANEVFGQAWNFILDLNFAGEESRSTENWWKELGDLVPEEKRQKIEVIRKKQTPKEDAFKYAKDWMATVDNLIRHPETIQDWDAISETHYWSYRFQLAEKVNSWLPNNVLSSALQNLTLKDFSQLALGMYLSNPKMYLDWLDENRTIIEEKLAGNYNIVSLEEKEDTIILHFLTYPENIKEDTRQLPVHDEALNRIQLVRQLFPQYDKYGSQGYGHQIPGFGINHDDTTKSGIVKEYLLPSWPLRINGIASGLAQYQFRPEKWDDYLSRILEIKEDLLKCLLPLPRETSRYFSREKPINLLELDIIKQGNWSKCIEKLDHIPLLPKVAVDPWGITQPEGKLLDKLPNSERLLPLSVLNQIYKPYLETTRKYFSAMRAFLEQSLHVMVINFRAGKFPENSPQKLATIEELVKKGVVKNNENLSTFNLTEGKAALIEHQKNFRKLFGHQVDSALLENLEKREMESIDRLWPLWYFFASHPRTASANALQQIPIRIDKIENDFKKSINSALNQLDEQGAKAKVHEINEKWQDSPTQWIFIDINDPLTIYSTVEELIKVLKNAFGIVHPSSLEYQILGERIPYIIIVPTVRGRMINSLVWPLRTVFTVASDTPIEDKQWAYVPQEIQQDQREKLGIKMWETDGINSANALSAAVSGLGLLLSIIETLENMPDTTQSGQYRLNTFLEQRSRELSEFLQSFIDSGAILLAKFNSLTEQEKIARPKLVEAVETLIAIHDQVLPSENLNGKEKLDLNDKVQYSLRIQSAFPQVENVRFLWIADIIISETDN